MLSQPRILLICITVFAGVWLLQELTRFDILWDDVRFGVLSPMTSLFNSVTNGSLPKDNPASSQFLAWLKAFNAHDRDTLLAYHDAYFPFEVAEDTLVNIDLEIRFAESTGGFHVIKALSSAGEGGMGEQSSAINVLLRENKSPQFARSMMKVDIHNDSHPVTAFEIRATHTPIEFVPDGRKKEYERALAPLTPARRGIVVKEISDVITKQYISPDVGEKMVSHLESKLKNGEYDDFTDSELFAQRLTDDLHAISRDKHIHVIFAEPPPRPKNGDDDDDDDDEKKPQKLFDIVKDINFGFGTPSIETVKGKKLGYLPIEGFVPSTPEIASDFVKIRKEISNILSKVADTDALIIDLRINGGGDPDTVSFMLSYFLEDGPVHLIDFIDRDGVVQQSTATLPVSDLPNGASVFGNSKPLLVLTSKNTISGGEEMAYDLQASKRAKFVVGEDEATAGAANPITNPRFICEEEFGKKWWLVAIPNLRPVNKVTGTNWEGVGVKSDVLVGVGDGFARGVGCRMAIDELGVVDEGLLVQRTV
jgi:hypothetical protein